jgi:hypothetical protein
VIDINGSKKKQAVATPLPVWHSARKRRSTVIIKKMEGV